MAGAEPLPKVTPYLVERAGDLCPRRLRLHFQGQRGDGGAFLRGRVRDAMVVDARAAHAEMGPPNTGSFWIRQDLLAEEQRVQGRCIEHYLELFGDEAVRAIDHADYESPVERRGVLVGGWIDLACEREDGDAEYRQFEVWGRDLSADPTQNMGILLAVLRLSRWVDDRRLHVRLADLVAGRVSEEVIDLPARRDELVSLYEERLGVVETRTRRAQAVPGDHCTACPFVPGCPAFS